MNALLTSSFLLIDPAHLTVDPNNIRQTPNPVYRQLKDSIRADHGQAVVFPVARANDQAPWLVVGGFGSRLRAVQELKQDWNSPEPNPYLSVRCLEISLAGDFPQLLAGLRENSVRGDTSYAELCLAMEKSRQMWDTEQKSNSPDTAFLAFMRESGISFSPATYSRMKTTATKLFPLLPKWLLQGRANAASIRLYIDFRVSVVKAISSPPEWVALSVELNSKQATQFFDKHFEAIAPSADSAELDWNKDLQRPMVRRLASALSISSNELSRLLLDKQEAPTVNVEPTPVFNAFSNTLHSPIPQWETLAKDLDVPTTFEGCLRAIAQMSPRESARFIGELKSTYSDRGSHVSSN